MTAAATSPARAARMLADIAQGMGYSSSSLYFSKLSDSVYLSLARARDRLDSPCQLVLRVSDHQQQPGYQLGAGRRVDFDIAVGGTAYAGGDGDLVDAVFWLADQLPGAGVPEDILALRAERLADEAPTVAEACAILTVSWIEELADNLARIAAYDPDHVSYTWTATTMTARCGTVRGRAARRSADGSDWPGARARARDQLETNMQHYRAQMAPLFQALCDSLDGVPGGIPGLGTSAGGAGHLGD